MEKQEAINSAEAHVGQRLIAQMRYLRERRKAVYTLRIGEHLVLV